MLTADSAHPDRERVVQALETLEALHRTGALKRLRNRECGSEPWPRCPDEMQRPPTAGACSACSANLACSAGCRGAWHELERVKKARDELELVSADPKILAPFSRAVRELSPAPGPDECDAPIDSLVQAQRALLRHLFELDPIPLDTIYAEADEHELECLKVSSLSGFVPVAPASAAPYDEVQHGRAVHIIGRALRDDEADSNRPRRPRAIVEMSFYCGPECGGADAYAVELRGDTWHVVDTWHAWDS